MEAASTLGVSFDQKNKLKRAAKAILTYQMLKDLQLEDISTHSNQKSKEGDGGMTEQHDTFIQLAESQRNLVLNEEDIDPKQHIHINPDIMATE